MKKIDVHVHLPGVKYFPKSLNQIYVEIITRLIRQSPIDACVILAIDANYDEDGRLRRKQWYYVPNDYVFRICQEHDELLPGISINPNRKDAIDELERCVERGAALVKWQPHMQEIDPANKKYQEFYRKLAQHKLPLLTHTGLRYILKTTNQDYGDPKRLRLALEEGVTVIAAHSGNPEPFRKGFFRDFIHMLDEYPNLYGDISPSFSRKNRNLQLIKDEIMRERLVNGSDTFPPFTPYFFGKIPMKEILSYPIPLIPSNPFTKDYEIKKALGIPDDVFHRGYALIKK